MATAESLISVLSMRLRDPQRTATTNDQWLSIISRAEALWNAVTMKVIVEGTLSVEPYSVVYSVNTVFPDCIRLITLRDGDHTLWPLDAKGLRNMDPAWLRNVGANPEQWSMLGRDLLLIHPAVEAARDLTVAYVQYTPILTTLQQELTMPEHEHAGILDLAEALAALRLRQFKLLMSAGERVKARVGA